MKRLAFIAVFIISPAAFALTTADVLAQKDAYAFDILAKPEFAKLINSSLASELRANTETSFPSALLDKRFLLISGCEPHNCGDNTAMAVIDSKNPKAVLVVRIQQGDPAAVNADQTNIVYIRNSDWASSINETRFPELLKAIQNK